jgi:hypothetical protein
VLMAPAMLVLGCGFAGAPAQIVTGGPAGEGETVGCLLMGPTGRLVVDPVHGTAFVKEWPSYVEGPPPGWSPEPGPVAWPHGYTAKWAGSEIEVHDASGDLVAVTGQRYEIAGRVWGSEEPSLPTGFPGGVVGCITPR